MKLLTPFYGKHLEYGATLIDVRGWQLAAVYTSVDFIDYSFQSAIAVAGKEKVACLSELLSSVVICVG